MWAKGEISEYHERRACNTCEEIGHGLGENFFPAPDEQFRALGAAPETDNYRLLTQVCELSPRAHGIAARSLGSNIPFSSLLQAVAQHQPELVWLSVSYVADLATFLSDYRVFMSSLPCRHFPSR